MIGTRRGISAKRRASGGAAIALVGSPVVLSYASQANPTIAMPGVAGNYLTACFAIGGPAAVTPTTPAGWTLITDVTYSAPTDPWYVHLLAYGRVSTGAANATWTHSTAYSQAVVEAWSGVDAASPIDSVGTPVQQNGFGGPSSAALSITTLTDGAMEILARGSWDGNPITPPAGVTERSDTPVLWVGDRLQAVAGASGSLVIPGGNGGLYPLGGLIFALKAA